MYRILWLDPCNERGRVLVKLIALNLDSTTLHSKMGMSEENIQAIQNAQQQVHIIRDRVFSKVFNMRCRSNVETRAAQKSIFGFLGSSFI